MWWPTLPLKIWSLVLFNSFVDCSPEQPDITYPALYQWGKEAYTNGRWYECVAFMKRALEDYHYFNGVVQHCHKKCKRLVQIDPFPLSDWQIDQKSVVEHRLWEKILQKSLCLSRCVDERFVDRPVHDPAHIAKVNAELEQLLPYSYMQLCYWKLDDLEHAVPAAYTYLTRNANDTMMINNLNFYQNQRGFSTRMLKNLNEFEHETLYEKAMDYYDDEDFDNAAINFELTLDSFFKSLENCYSLCTGVQSYENIGQTFRSLDVYSAMSGYFRKLFPCRLSCVQKLMTIKTIPMSDFIAIIFNHLQFAYWKVNKLRKACEAVATYLLLSPDDRTMLDNKKFYLSQRQVSEELFVPRENIKDYVERYVLDVKLLAYMDEKFKQWNKDGEFSTEREDDYRELRAEADADFSKLLRHYDELATVEKDGNEDRGDDDAAAAKKAQKGAKGDDGAKGRENKFDNKVITTALTETGFYTPPAEILKLFHDRYGINLIQKERDLNGSFRFVAENLLSKQECDQLMQLKDLSQLGDGYAGKGSPHTRHENFHGLTIGKLTDLASESKVPLRLAKLFYDKSELARNFVEKYFNLTSTLYVDYTHFACRTTKPGSQFSHRDDLSHPIHGDNCMLKDGRCDKRFPAFTWRDFSAIVYLNDDFDGGEFIFADSSEHEAARVKPKCGQMVSFTGSTLHGVKAVTKGTRCAMALWMTLDPTHEEVERIQAKKTLSTLTRNIIDGQVVAKSDIL